MHIYQNIPQDTYNEIKYYIDNRHLEAQLLESLLQKLILSVIKGTNVPGYSDVI